MRQDPASAYNICAYICAAMTLKMQTHIFSTMNSMGNVMHILFVHDIFTSMYIILFFNSGNFRRCHFFCS